MRTVRTLLPVAVLAALSCGESARHRAERLNADRWAALRSGLEARVHGLAVRCRETPDQFMRLLTRDTVLSTDFRGVREPLPSLLNAVDSATLHHDPTKDCSGVVDSIVQVLRRQ